MAVLTIDEIIVKLNDETDSSTRDLFFTEDERGVDFLTPASTVTLVDGTDNNDFKVIMRLIESRDRSIIVHAVSVGEYFLISNYLGVNGEETMKSMKLTSEHYFVETVGTDTVFSAKDGNDVTTIIA